MGRKRVLITGVSSPLGEPLARKLADHPGVSYLAGLDLSEPEAGDGNFDFIKADIRNPMIRRVLASAEVDTIVHTALVSAPKGAGGRSAQKERNVIGTMQLLGACQRLENLKKIVVRSSTAVYGVEPGSPSLLTEDDSSRLQASSGYSKDVFESETYARDFSRRRPDVNVTILRMTNVVGGGISTNMSQFLSLPLVPAALGFDPRLQLLHSEDALEVLARSVVEDHPGVFNVAADGVVYLSQALRILRRIPLPIALPLARIAASALKATGAVDFPQDQLELVLHGRVTDNTRLKKVFGYQPRFTTVEALSDFAASTSGSQGGDISAQIYERIDQLMGVASR